LILGTGKSGTTALYFRIKNSLSGEAQGLFEPREREPIAAAVAANRPLVAKMLLPIAPELLDELKQWFDRRILLVRDPRDVVVSSVLYTSAYDYCWKHSEAQIRAHLGLLRAKEADSGRVSVLCLLEALWDGFDRNEFAALIETLSRQLHALASPPHDYFVVKYEELIAGRLSPLEAYLGFRLTGNDAVDPAFSRVVRTKGSGAWRDWFTPEDTAFFAPLVRPNMIRFGYDTEDWRTRAGAQLASTHCSDYFLKVVNERRRAADKAEIDP
jgi:hypothetical protein